MTAVRALWLVTFVISALLPQARAGAAEPLVEPPKAVELVDAVVPPGQALADVEVVLWVTIEADGSVGEIAIKRGGGPPWDDAAIEAVRRSTFSAGLRDGTPYPMTVPFRYQFRRPARRGRVVPARQARRAIEQAPGLVYAGRVVEKGSRTPQAGVPVVVRDPRTGRSYEALTDEEGRFIVHGLPSGRLVLDIFTGDFEELQQSFRARTTDEKEARARARSFYLDPSGMAAYRTVIREKKPPRAASVIDLTEDELRKVPGTFGDPTRVVATLPGVARSPFGLGYYLVRGASFDNTGFFIDGHPAVFLYHLLGGPGVVHPELVGGLSFYPGGYPAEYGRFASGIIAIDTKDPPVDRWHLDIEIDLLKAALLFSVPVDDGKGVIALSFRRSYYELLLPLITDEISLNYTDYQVRGSYQFSPAVRGRVVVMGAEDRLEARDVSTADGSGTSSSDFGLGFHRVNFGVDIALSETLTLANSLVWEFDHINNRRIAEGDDTIDGSISGWFTQLLSSVTFKPAKGIRLEAGIDALYTSFGADLTVPSAPPLGDPRPPVFDPIVVSADVDSPTTSVAPYLSADLEVFDGLRLLPGIRADIQKYGDRVRVTMDPKLAFRWQLDDQWTLKGMGALAHQPPSLFQVAEPYGDPSLPTIEATQASLGFEYKPAPDWLISVEGFVQLLDQLAQPSDAVIDDDGDVGRVYWDTDLDGRAFGLELLIRREFGDLFYGWLSYTMSRAERRRDAGWTLFEFDQTHVLNLAWTVRLGAEWSLGLRFQLASGNPTYPIVGSRYDADQDKFEPLFSDRRERIQLYHRLDLRLDKRWRFEDWMFEFYVDIQNVYNATNPESPQYSYDYSRKVDGASIPILPTIGFRAIF